mgnify:CR=1 FL=1
MLNLSAFGKNDIRGIYGENITEELFYYTGRGFVKYLTNQTGKSNPEIWITVCRDARLHSPSLSKSLVSGLFNLLSSSVEKYSIELLYSILLDINAQAFLPIASSLSIASFIFPLKLSSNTLNNTNL